MVAVGTAHSHMLAGVKHPGRRPAFNRLILPLMGCAVEKAKHQNPAKKTHFYRSYLTLSVKRACSQFRTSSCAYHVMKQGCLFMFKMTYITARKRFIVLGISRSLAILYTDFRSGVNSTTTKQKLQSKQPIGGV